MTQFSGPFRSMRPIYSFAMNREWTACAGSERIGPSRMFHWEAINDLPPEADVEPTEGGYSCLEPYGARPCSSYRPHGPQRYTELYSRKE